MIKITKKSSYNFLCDINYMEGANVNGININLTSNDSLVCAKDSVSIEFQLEGENSIVRLEMREILKYSLTDLVGVSLFGLSGDPHSLIVEWYDDSVVVALGACINEIKYQNLVRSNFFIESKYIYTDFYN